MFIDWTRIECVSKFVWFHPQVVQINTFLQNNPTWIVHHPSLISRILEYPDQGLEEIQGPKEIQDPKEIQGPEEIRWP